MSKNQPKLSEQQKKRTAKISEIIKKNIETRKESITKIDAMLKKYGDTFDDLCDDILYNLSEIQRATFVKILVETLFVRATLTGFILAGVIEHIHQDLITQPLASIKLIQGKQMIKDTILNMQQESSKDKSGYIR